MIERGQVAFPVIVRLDLPRAEVIAKEFVNVLEGIAEGGADKLRCLLRPDGIAYYIIIVRVDDEDHRRAVVVGRYLSAVGVAERPLVKQLHVPAVGRPEVHRAGRSHAAHLHRLLVPECLRPVPPGVGLRVGFLEVAHRPGRDALPTHFHRHSVIKPRDGLVVQVTPVAGQFRHERLLLFRFHFAGIVVLMFLRDKGGISIRFVPVDNPLQSLRVLGQLATQLLLDAVQLFRHLPENPPTVPATQTDSGNALGHQVDNHVQDGSVRHIRLLYLLFQMGITIRGVTTVEVFRPHIPPEQVPEGALRGKPFGVAILGHHPLLVPLR